MDIASHTYELLDFVHHFVASAQDLGQSLNLVYVFLAETEPKFEQLFDVLAHWIAHLRHLLLFIDQLNDGPRQIYKSLFIHRREIIGGIYWA